MERKLGEIDRARAIYVHCSQICDPKVIITLLLITEIAEDLHFLLFSVESKILASLERV